MSRGAKYLEIEFKYRANALTLQAFTDFCKELSPAKHTMAAGYDYFYENKSKPGCFWRHRVGPDFNQWTFKRKTNDANNYIRTEHNVDLLPSVSVDRISAVCADLGYEFNTSIYKSVFIYYYDRHNFVYYVCYDKDMTELGRFMEIEMSEEHPWESEEHARSELLALEHKARVLGISAQARMKKSLFEQFRKV